MEFDIFNPDTWHLLKDDTPLVYESEIIISENGEPIKAVDFVNFLKAISTAMKNSGESGELDRRTVEKLLQRMKDNKQQKEEVEEEFLLTPETEEKIDTGFNPFDESTWNLASEKVLMRINGAKLIKDGVYMSEKDFLQEIQTNIKYNINNKSVKEIVDANLNFCFSLYAEKDLEPVFTVNGVSFSKALCDTCRDTEKETLEKIANAVNYCIKQNLKKYQYKQCFFENFTPADKEFFVEVYFAEQYKTRKDVDDLIVAFYSEYEPETKEEAEQIIGSSLYLKTHQELIPAIKEAFQRKIDNGNTTVK